MKVVVTNRSAAARLRFGNGLEWLDQIYREVCGCRVIERAQAVPLGNQQVTVVPAPRSLSAETLPP